MSTPLQEQTQQVNRIRDTYLRVFGNSLLFAGAELILFSPLVVTTHLYLSEISLWPLIVQFMLVFVAGSLLGRITWLSRTLYELLGCALVGFAAAYLFQGNNWHSWTCAAIGMLLAYRGIRCTKDGWPAIFPGASFAVAGAVYFIGVPIMGHQAIFQPYMGWLNGLGFVSLIIFFFAMQRTGLLTATLASDERAASSSLSETVKRSSRIWLTVLIALIFVVAYFQQLRQGIVAGLRAAIAWLMSLLQSGPPPETLPEPSSSAPPPLLPPAEAKEPSWLDALFHYIQVIFGYLIVIALIVLAVYVIVTKLLPVVNAFLRRLMNRSLSSKQDGESEGFIDEKEALVDWKGLPRLWWQQVRKGRNRERSHARKWSLLPNNRERVRYLYRLLIEQAAQSGYTYKEALTPNETEKDLSLGKQLPSETVHAITTAYNQVRYGETDISDAQLDQVLQAAEPSLRNHFK
ncbi:DUF4129 domain-containing protein [Paenibacillus chondroitinus]|uniref:DUF4129 domain-containing protein n=1 Tax=Paenibacillus chondroitinus TaxID=59842 RepID=A0ABU6DM93_9BACL|nr:MULTISPECIES: DUF4129 domain-containing protein [Paenibacillus]MCY9657431.1 DUF4129 domain-containing protein [Paenibacillus anseongense]MEB4798904.1 DUF4129 domain-containing protein [Paenibacillus chondroitinus]